MCCTLTGLVSYTQTVIRLLSLHQPIFHDHFTTIAAYILPHLSIISRRLILSAKADQWPNLMDSFPRYKDHVWTDAAAFLHRGVRVRTMMPQHAFAQSGNPDTAATGGLNGWWIPQSAGITHTGQHPGRRFTLGVKHEELCEDIDPHSQKPYRRREVGRMRAADRG